MEFTTETHKKKPDVGCDNACSKVNPVVNSTDTRKKKLHVGDTSCSRVNTVESRGILWNSPNRLHHIEFTMETYKIERHAGRGDTSCKLKGESHMAMERMQCTLT